MAYKCVHCSKVYDDGAREILEGCECKSKFFFYIKEEKLREIQQNKEEEEVKLTATERKQMEEDVREITGIKEESPVFLDFESVKVMKPGKYLIDLQKLFAMDKPRIYKLEDGKYIVDLTTLMMKSSDDE